MHALILYSSVCAPPASRCEHELMDYVRTYTGIAVRHIGTFTFWGPGLPSWHPNHIYVGSLYSWRKTCLVGVRLVTVHADER